MWLLKQGAAPPITTPTCSRFNINTAPRRLALLLLAAALRGHATQGRGAHGTVVVVVVVAVVVVVVVGSLAESLGSPVTVLLPRFHSKERVPPGASESAGGATDRGNAGSNSPLTTPRATAVSPRRVPIGSVRTDRLGACRSARCVQIGSVRADRLGACRSARCTRADPCEGWGPEGEDDDEEDSPSRRPGEEEESSGREADDGRWTMAAGGPSRESSAPPMQTHADTASPCLRVSSRPCVRASERLCVCVARRQSPGDVLSAPRAMERRTTAKQLYEQRKNYARSSNIKAETAQYHVEHLSTFEMDRKEGLVNMEDGIRRLRLLDSTGKIWTQDMLLQVDERSVSLVDIESKEELENFTLVSILSCQAVLTEPNYSSILALTCTEVGQARPDLHLFHCVEVGAELIKNDIDSAIADSKDGRKNRRPETLRLVVGAAVGAAVGQLWGSYSDRFSVYSQDADETPEMMAKRVDRDVQILNHLLDDIELFVARLQKSAEAYGELSKRKKEKKGKRKGEGVLTLRSKPPPPGEFREILQKFKYCFNLLARLKGHIQNPDSIELVHFLFTPLEMVVQSTGGPDLARLITSPLLTRDCIDMLHGCLAAKERELWKSCGDAWNKSKAEWPRDQHVPPYVPRFRSGWEPPLLDVPVRERERERAREHVAELADGRGGAPPAHHYNEPPWMHSEVGRSAVPSPHRGEGFDGSAAPPPRSPLGPQTAIVRYDFMARNSNELAVRKDDLVEVIENSKQWWKVRSVTGHEGYVPNNILDLLKGGGDAGGIGGGGLHDEPLYSRALQKQRTDSSSHYPGPASPGLPLPPNGLQRQGSVDSANAAGPEPPRGNNNNQRDPASQHGELQEELLKRLTGQNVNKRNFMIPRSKGTAVVLSFDSSPDDVKSWLVAKGFNNLTVDSLGVLTGAQIFSLNKEELKAVCPDEGARVYSQITVQKSALESARGTSELEEIMKKRKEKISSVDKNGSENVTA
ncbi:unnamed protein product [Lampetra planeri]